MKQRDYLLDLLDYCTVKPYSQSLHYTNEKAIKILKDYITKATDKGLEDNIEAKDVKYDPIPKEFRVEPNLTGLTPEEARAFPPQQVTLEHTQIPKETPIEVTTPTTFIKTESLTPGAQELLDKEKTSKTKSKRS